MTQALHPVRPRRLLWRVLICFSVCAVIGALVAMTPSESVASTRLRAVAPAGPVVGDPAQSSLTQIDAAPVALGEVGPTESSPNPVAAVPAVPASDVPASDAPPDADPSDAATSSVPTTPPPVLAPIAVPEQAESEPAAPDAVESLVVIAEPVVVVEPVVVAEPVVAVAPVEEPVVVAEPVVVVAPAAAAPVEEPVVVAAEPAGGVVAATGGAAAAPTPASPAPAPPAPAPVVTPQRSGPAGVVSQIPASAWQWLDTYGWRVDWRQGPGPGRVAEAQYATSTIVIWYDTARPDSIWAGAFAHELGHAVSYVHFSNQQMNDWNQRRGLASWRWIPGMPNDFSVGEGDFAEAFMSYLLGHQVRSVGGSLSPADRAWIAANTPF